MRRSTLDRLRCPRCLAGSLVPEAPVAETALVFGPALCIGCKARFPVHEGIIDFSLDTKHASAAAQLMQLSLVARSWERTLRPVIDQLMSRGRIKKDNEYEILRHLIGTPVGPCVDVGCGSGLFLRRLARDYAEVTVIGVDDSAPMLEEALAQTREDGAAVDLVRARVPPLPFTESSVGVILATGLVHFVEDLDAMMREAARVLKPRGRLVASTFDSPEFVRSLYRRAGLYPRHEEQLREAAARAGFIRFEQVTQSPFLTWKVERP